MPDDHSTLVPPLPIPNRTVKRRRADDSVDYPCESRSSSGTPYQANGPPRVGRCALCPRAPARAEALLPHLAAARVGPKAAGTAGGRVATRTRASDRNAEAGGSGGGAGAVAVRARGRSMVRRQ